MPTMGIRFSVGVVTAALLTTARNNGLNTPPTESETVAAGSLDVNYTFR